MAKTIAVFFMDSDGVEQKAKIRSTQRQQFCEKLENDGYTFLRVDHFPKRGHNGSKASRGSPVRRAVGAR